MLLRARTAAWGLALMLAGVGCSSDWDLLDPRVGAGAGASGGATATGGGGSGGVGGGAGAAGGVGATGATGGTGGDGGSGGMGSSCGDGVIDVALGEECDDGNDVGGDLCFGCIVECAGSKDPETLHCYKLETVGATWDGARMDCLDWGGDLVALSDSDEHDFVNTLYSTDGPYWTGGTDVDTEGVYVWSNGEPWVYEPWEPGEPNDDGAGNQNCIDIFDNPAEGPLLGDNPCTQLSQYICERYPPMP